MKSARGRESSRLLSLPDELLQPVLARVDHPRDRCLVTSLELDSPLERHSVFNDPPPPPVDAFPSLRSLTLLYEPSHYRFISRCPSLTSLTLWGPNAFALYSLASPSSPLRLSLASLTIHSARLEAALSPLASFPRLTSLSFLSCTIDPCELHALSRSLHTLTHLALLSCPLVSSHSLAALAQTNPALSSLSLYSTSYPLFAAQGLLTLLRTSSSRLHTLNLSGLPSYRPGMLGLCSSLKRLTVKGLGEARESVMPSEAPQKPSLECLVAMLVRVEQWGGSAGMVAGDDRVGRRQVEMVVGNGEGGGAAAAAAAADDGEAAMTAHDAAALPAATTLVESETGIRGHMSPTYLDFRMEAAAARADMVAAIDDWRALMGTCEWRLQKVISQVMRARHMRGEFALSSIRNAIIQVRAAISLCLCVRLSVNEVNARIAREEALVEACTAAQAAGLFTAPLDEEMEPEGHQERGGQRGGGREVEELVGFSPESDLPADLAEVSETLLGEETGGWPAFVAVSQREARGLLQALTQQLVARMEAVACGAPPGAPPTVPGAAPLPGAAPAGPGPAATDAATLEGAGTVAAEGVRAEEAVSQGPTSAEGDAGGRVGEGARRARALQQLPGAEAGGGPGGDEQLGSRVSTHSPPHKSTPPEKSTPPNINTLVTPVQVFFPPLEALTLESIRFASTLKSLALVSCSGLAETLLVRLLRACGMLEELRVEGSDGFSDGVITGSKLEVLTRLTAVGCGGVTAGGIGGLLGNVPRLRYLKAEASKVSERARRELLRAGVVVRGV
ncbi:unnamed protein product [Closterium sp. Naga37s-1]|nr:unnamed protein product [Closterium sp. Naga37s-1]